MYMNRITLIGFTGQDARSSATQTGREVTRFTLATTKRYQQASEWKAKTQWHDCVVYGGYAPYAAKLSKGAHIVIEGELRIANTIARLKPKQVPSTWLGR